MLHQQQQNYGTFKCVPNVLDCINPNFDIFLKVKLLIPFKDVCNLLRKLTWLKMPIALMCFITLNKRIGPRILL